MYRITVSLLPFLPPFLQYHDSNTTSFPSSLPFSPLPSRPLSRLLSSSLSYQVFVLYCIFFLFYNDLFAILPFFTIYHYLHSFLNVILYFIHPHMKKLKIILGKVMVPSNKQMVLPFI